MKTIKIKIELPTLAEITEGLDEQSCYPKLAKAEAGVAKAESDLAAAREKLAALESNAGRMPELIRRGEEPIDALASLLRSRDAAALCIPPCAAELEKVREALEAAKVAAAEAVKKELTKRTALLVAAAAQVAPMLEQLLELDEALGKIDDPRNWGTGQVTWPSSAVEEIHYRNAMMR